MSNKFVFLFDEVSGDQTKELLGGKGANLAEMTRIGLPVPPGFTITTEACNEYYRNGDQLLAGLMEEVNVALKTIEEKTGKKFGDRENPLLISVRSGAAISMPGMMDTILNLGLNDETVEGLASLTGNSRFARDCYRRFIQMFSDVVLDVEHSLFDSVMERYKKQFGLQFDYEIPEDKLQNIISEYKEISFKATGHEFPRMYKNRLKWLFLQFSGVGIPHGPSVPQSQQNSRRSGNGR